MVRVIKKQGGKGEKLKTQKQISVRRLDDGKDRRKQEKQGFFVGLSEKGQK